MFSESSVLTEVPPSPSNIALPMEEEEEWTANDMGGFYRGSFRRPHPTIQPTICKNRKSKRHVEYFVNHCENTQCTFAPGHDGLCSHQLVTGRRGGRSLKLSPL